MRTVQLACRNTRDLPVTIEIRRHFATAYWALRREERTGQYNKIDADTIQFRITLAPHSQETIRYELRTYHGTREEDAR